MKRIFSAAALIVALAIPTLVLACPTCPCGADCPCGGDCPCGD